MRTFWFPISSPKHGWISPFQCMSQIESPNKYLIYHYIWIVESTCGFPLYYVLPDGNYTTLSGSWIHMFPWINGHVVGTSIYLLHKLPENKPWISHEIIISGLGPHLYLVGSAITILKNMKVNGRIIPQLWKNNPNVVNHQPVLVG